MYQPLYKYREKPATSGPFKNFTNFGPILILHGLLNLENDMVASKLYKFQLGTGLGSPYGQRGSKLTA